jgi:hypothetical protein
MAFFTSPPKLRDSRRKSTPFGRDFVRKCLRENDLIDIRWMLSDHFGKELRETVGIISKKILKFVTDRCNRLYVPLVYADVD